MTDPSHRCDNCRYQREDVDEPEVMNWRRGEQLAQIVFLCVALPQIVEIQPGRPACSLYQPRAEA